MQPGAGGDDTSSREIDIVAGTLALDGVGGLAIAQRGGKAGALDHHPFAGATKRVLQ